MLYFAIAIWARAGKLADSALDDLTYVVFDTETTGLRPEKGD